MMTDDQVDLALESIDDQLAAGENYEWGRAACRALSCCTGWPRERWLNFLYDRGYIGPKPGVIGDVEPLPPGNWEVVSASIRRVDDSDGPRLGVFCPDECEGAPDG